MTAAVGAVAGRAAAGTGSTASATRAVSAGSKSAQAGEVLAALPRSRSRPTATSARGRGGQRVLLAELLVCVLLVGLHPLSRPEGEVTPAQWIKRATAVSFLFVGLGAVSAIGPRASRAANAFGGLVALVLLIDQRSIFTMLARKLSAESPSTPLTDTPAGASSGGETGGGGGG